MRCNCNKKGLSDIAIGEKTIKTGMFNATLDEKTTALLVGGGAALGALVSFVLKKVKR